MGRVGSNEMGESGGEDIGSVTHRAATLMDEFQFFAFIEGEEVGDEEAWLLRFKLNHGHCY